MFRSLMAIIRELYLYLTKVKKKRWLFNGYDTSLKELSKTVAIPIRIGYLPNRQALHVRIRVTKLCL